MLGRLPEEREASLEARKVTSRLRPMAAVGTCSEGDFAADFDDFRPCRPHDGVYP